MMNRPSPYVGPRAFKPGEMLYGRDREALDLVRLVVPERIVLLYSPSGAGKTSLLTAKLISHDELKEHKFQILGPARVFGPAGLGSPSDSFNPYVSSLIHDWEEGCKDEKLTDLGGIDLSGYLAQRSWIREDPNPKMLILDQFEEILTHNPLDKEKKLEFFRQLGTALRDRNRWAIIAMKEEYIAGLDPYLHLLPTRLAARYRLELLSHEQAEQAIKEPAKSAGVVYRPEALKRLVGELSTVHEPGVDVYHTPYIEPLHLQVVCDGLWQKLPDGATEVGPKLIETAGNVNEALGGYYGDAVHAIAQTVQGEDAGAVERRIRDWFESELISPTGLRDQLQRGAQTTGSLPNNLIDALGGRYLLRMEMRRGTQWYEIAHDRLVEVIRSNNQAWYERQEKALQILENQASKWLKHHAAGRSAEADAELLAGDTRVLVEEWARDHPGILKDSDRRFLAASAAREMKQKNLRSMKWVVVAVTLLLLLTLVYIIVTQKRNYRILALLNDKNAELSSSLTKVNMEQKQTISLLEKSRNEMRAHKLLADSAQARWRLNDHELAALLALQSERYAAKLNNREFSARILDNLRSILQLRPFILSPKLDGLPEKARKGGLLDFSPDGSFIAAQSNESEFEVLPLFE
ncbi:MAG: hypothetical protein LLG06_06130, partial [Desulfobacteraceae bacterium]|nr:hypothetical protein [Desulfobacteraceae bacterium]